MRLKKLLAWSIIGAVPGSMVAFLALTCPVFLAIFFGVCVAWLGIAAAVMWAVKTLAE